MKIKHLFFFAFFVAAAAALTGCNDSKSYAELLTDETKAINVFLSNQNVILDLPADGNLLAGEDAPYYRLDEDGNVFMQIIERGQAPDIPNDAQVYFRFTRYSLSEYAVTGTMPAGQGNADDLDMGNSSFRYNNTSLSSSTQWGTGIQMPLKYVGYYGRVNLVVKSQYGLTSEISQVIPYLYDITYLPSVSD